MRQFTRTVSFILQEAKYSPQVRSQTQPIICVFQISGHFVTHSFHPCGLVYRRSPWFLSPPNIRLSKYLLLTQRKALYTANIYYLYCFILSYCLSLQQTVTLEAGATFSSTRYHQHVHSIWQINSHQMSNIPNITMFPVLLFLT